MRLLLDTHAFLWWISDDPRLSPVAREVLADGANHVYLSAASGWEIAIKVGLNRLTLPDPLGRFIPEQLRLNAIDGLPVELSHALHVSTLPPYHRDPFDRLLVAQAQMETLPILTADPEIRRYDVSTLW